MTVPRVLAGLALAAAATRQARRQQQRIGLRGKVALVTGGSAGLGLQIARELVARGAQVVICGRDQTTLEGAAAELRAAGGVVEPYVCDVADRRAVEAMVRDVEARLGPVEVLVNNAGEIDIGEVGPGEHETFARMLDIMFWGVLNPTLALLGPMRERGRGRIANVTSIGGRVAVPHLVAYSCAKHAAYAFSQGLRAEVADDGILVTTVVPGLMHTGSHRAARVRGGDRAEYSWFAVAGANALSATSPEHAARRIVSGLRHGDAHVVIGLDAKIATRVEGLAPATVNRILSLVDRVLPDTADGGSTARRPGWSLETALTRSAATRAGREQAADLQRHRPDVAEEETPA